MIMAMENKENGACLELNIEEQEEDVLSLCNLNMLGSDGNSAIQSPREYNSSSAQEFFEFFNESSSPEYYSAPDIIFCGKIIHEDDDDGREDQLNEYQKRDYLTTVRSHSFRRPPSYDQYPFLMSNESVDPSSQEHKIRSTSTTIKSSSLRVSASSNSHNHSASTSYHAQRVNITSLTSMSAKSRRRMFMFGPVKFKPEMELSAIKERQGRQRSTTTVMSPPTVVVDGGKAVVDNNGGKRSHWGMVRLLKVKGRGHFTTVLAKSLAFGCIPTASSAGNWIKVAN